MHVRQLTRLATLLVAALILHGQAKAPPEITLASVEDTYKILHGTSPLMFNDFHNTILSEFKALDCNAVLAEAPGMSASGFNCLLSRLLLIELTRDPILALDSDWVVLQFKPLVDRIVATAKKELSNEGALLHEACVPTQARARIVFNLSISAIRLVLESVRPNDSDRDLYDALSESLVLLSVKNIEPTTRWRTIFTDMEPVIARLSSFAERVDRHPDTPAMGEFFRKIHSYIRCE